MLPASFLAGTITETEVRCCHGPERVAFVYPKPTFPCDRQRRSQNFERIAPCAVQDIREPEVEVCEHSRGLVARALGVVHRLSAVR